MKIMEVIIFSKDGKLGLYDCNEKTLVKPQFDIISEISDYIYLKKNNDPYYYQYKLDKKSYPKPT